MSNAFLTKLATAETKAVTKGGTGVRTSAHSGEAYTNKSGRMFGLSDKHNFVLEIELGEQDGTSFIKVRPAEPLTTDENGKANYPKDYAKNAFKTSEVSTGTPFVTITKLCQELFGKDKKNWARDFQKQGELDGYTYYTLMDVVETKSEDNKKTDKKPAKKSDAQQKKQ